MRIFQPAMLVYWRVVSCFKEDFEVASKTIKIQMSLVTRCPLAASQGHHAWQVGPSEICGDELLGFSAANRWYFFLGVQLKILNLLLLENWSRKPNPRFSTPAIWRERSFLWVFLKKSHYLWGSFILSNTFLKTGVVRPSQRDYVQISYLESCDCARLEVEEPFMWPMPRDVWHLCLLCVLLKLEPNHAQGTNDTHVFEDWC